MAKYKATKWLPLLVHVTLYTLVVAVSCLVSGGLSSAAIVLIFISHIELDRKTFETLKRDSGFQQDKKWMEYKSWKSSSRIISCLV